MFGGVTVEGNLTAEAGRGGGIIAKEDISIDETKTAINSFYSCIFTTDGGVSVKGRLDAKCTAKTTDVDLNGKSWADVRKEFDIRDAVHAKKDITIKGSPVIVESDGSCIQTGGKITIEGGITAKSQNQTCVGGSGDVVINGLYHDLESGSYAIGGYNVSVTGNLTIKNFSSMKRVSIQPDGSL